MQHRYRRQASGHCRFSDVPGFDAVAKGEKVDVVKVLPRIVKAAMNTIKQHTEIQAI